VPPSSISLLAHDIFFFLPSYHCGIPREGWRPSAWRLADLLSQSLPPPDEADLLSPDLPLYIFPPLRFPMGRSFFGFRLSFLRFRTAAQMTILQALRGNTVFFFSLYRVCPPFPSRASSNLVAFPLCKRQSNSAGFGRIEDPPFFSGWFLFPPPKIGILLGPRRWPRVRWLL